MFPSLVPPEFTGEHMGPNCVNEAELEAEQTRVDQVLLQDPFVTCDDAMRLLGLHRMAANEPDVATTSALLLVQ